LAFHRDHRAPPGPEDRLPGGDRLSHEIYRRAPARSARRVARREHVRRLPEAGPVGEAARMNAKPAALPGVLILEPRVFEDARGQTFEGYNRRSFKDATGLEVEFVQDNVSRSKKNVIR